jgi:DNA-binding MarR family transcriptional regulator
MEGALLTRFAKQMEVAELIRRRVDPGDNRFTLVSLAPAGEKLLQDLEAQGAEFDRRLLDGLSQEDRATMVRTMKHILNNLAHWDKSEDQS